jgi:hypothetical protein
LIKWGPNSVNSVPIKRNLFAGVQQMQEHLYQKIRQGGLSIEQQKKLIGSLIHLDIQGDPAWESVQTR